MFKSREFPCIGQSNARALNSAYKDQGGHVEDESEKCSILQQADFGLMPKVKFNQPRSHIFNKRKHRINTGKGDYVLILRGGFKKFML